MNSKKAVWLSAKPPFINGSFHMLFLILILNFVRNLVWIFVWIFFLILI